MSHPSQPISVVVTRPMPAAQLWQKALAKQLPAAKIHSLPLIDIAPIEDQKAILHLHNVWQSAQQFHAAAFVSRFAVAYFFTHTKITGAQFNQLPIRAWAVGQGTRDALLQKGISPDKIDTPSANAAQFDSDILWQQVAPQLNTPQAQNKSILLVRGTDDNAQLPSPHKKNRLEYILQTHRVAHTSVFVYTRKAPIWTAQQQACAQQLIQKNSVWLFSSSMAVLHLPHLLPSIQAPQWRTQQAIATHARIAQTAATIGFCNIEQCRPVLNDVVQSILYLCQAKPTP